MRFFISFPRGENVLFFSPWCYFSEISFIRLHEFCYFLLWFKKKKISKAINVDVKLLVVISLKLSGTGTFLSLYPECLSDGPAPRGHSVVTENRELNQGQPGGGNGRCWFKSIVLNLCRINNSTDLMDSVMTMVNNTVSKTEYLLRE